MTDLSHTFTDTSMTNGVNPSKDVHIVHLGMRDYSLLIISYLNLLLKRNSRPLKTSGHRYPVNFRTFSSCRTSWHFCNEWDHKYSRHFIMLQRDRMVANFWVNHLKILERILSLFEPKFHTVLFALKMRWSILSAIWLYSDCRRSPTPNRPSINPRV